jgi:PrsW family intramembrane metalloprotease
MSTSYPSNQPSATPINVSALIQLVFSALAVILLLGLAVLIGVSGIFQYLSQAFSSSELSQSLMVATSLAFAGVLVLPSVWYAWKDFTNPHAICKPRPEQRNYTFILTLLVLVGVSAALLLGNWVSQNDQLSWFLLPFLNIIATGLPALWLVYIGTRGLLSGAPRRRWGVFASGLILSPAVILVLELFVILGLLILVLFGAMVDPTISSQLTNLMFRLQNSTLNPDDILNILLPIFLRPGLLFLAFAFTSVIVPLIEEALKPIGVWFQAGQKITPVQGFAYGVLCGAGFGLFENLGNTSAGGEMWAVLAATRISTLLLHCLTTGLVGWALASAWSRKRYLRLGLTYTFAVLLHGMWNGMAVISSLSSLEVQVNLPLPDYLFQLGNLATIGIVALGAFNLVLFISFSTFLRNNLKRQSPPITDVGSFNTPLIDEPTQAANGDDISLSIQATSTSLWMDPSTPMITDENPFTFKDNPPSKPDEN